MLAAFLLGPVVLTGGLAFAGALLGGDMREDPGLGDVPGRELLKDAAVGFDVPAVLLNGDDVDGGVLGVHEEVVEARFEGAAEWDALVGADHHEAVADALQLAGEPFGEWVGDGAGVDGVGVRETRLQGHLALDVLGENQVAHAGMWCRRGGARERYGPARADSGECYLRAIAPACVLRRRAPILRG